MMENPTRIYSGRMKRVNGLASIIVELELGFEIKATKTVIVEGVSSVDVPPRLRSDASHCLVVLLGGKEVFVQIAGDSDGEQNSAILGRVFLARKVFADPEGMMIPHGLSTPLLEIGTFFQSLKERSYDVDYVKAVLNGNGNGKSV